MKETGFWTSYAAVSLNNPAGLGITNNLPKSKYPGFPTIQAGIHAQVAHLLTYIDGAANPWKADDPRYADTVGSDMFGKARVIQDLEQHWAFTEWDKYNATPLNKRYAYTVAVLANELIATIGAQPVANRFIEVIDETDWDGDNRPGYPMTAKSITVHDTANTDPGADAMMHARFVHNGGGSEGVSFHYCVDDHQAVRILPDTENAWHAGDGRDGTGNRTSIAIETCVNSDGDWGKTKQNLARLIARICSEHGFPPDSAHIVQHNHWSGKDCPHIIRAEGSWNTILANVAALLNSATSQQVQPAGDPNAYQDPDTHLWIINQGDIKMLDAWRAEGGEVKCGKPLTGMTQDDDGVYRQIFENQMLEIWPNGWGGHPGPYARVGGLGQRYVALLQAKN